MSLTLLIALAVLLLVLVAGVAVLLRYRRGAVQLNATDRSLVQSRWQTIENHVAKGGATHFRQAIIEADKLVDYALKQLGVRGDTMGERLRHSEARYSDYQGLWQAHKLRNRIVHEFDREILSFEAKQNIARFRTALTDLGAL